MVMRLPEGDRVSMARDKLFADLRVACGGRIAEEMIFGAEKVTTGASSDIRMVSDVARRMVTEWGLSEKLGFLPILLMSRKSSWTFSLTARRICLMRRHQPLIVRFDLSLMVHMMTRQRSSRKCRSA